MKSIALELMLAIGCTSILCAAEVQIPSLTSHETTEVQRRLEAFEHGKTTLENITDNPEWTLQFIAYYSSRTNDVTTKMKLPISRSFAVWSKYPEAANLAQDYINVYSNDWRGWRVLGGAKLVMGSYNEAISALTNAARLGDEANYVGLGMAALAANRLDVLDSIVVPHLLILKNDGARFSKKERLEMRGVLVAYALQANKEEIFVKAIEDVDVNDIVSQEQLKAKVVRGCEQFKSKDLDKICQQIKAASQSESKTEKN